MSQWPTARQLRMAYAVCRGIARAQAKNFYYAFLALPQKKRNALCAVYAFMRHADDLSDDPGLSARDRDAKLREWPQALHSAVAGTQTDDPVILALADTVQRYKIPLEYFDQLVSGTMMDLQFAQTEVSEQGSTIAPYQTFDELYQYCYHVASVVGLVCLYIFQFEDARAKQYAELTGIAFQLTNIIRDVKEDALNGRIYLPLDDLAKFGRSPEELTRQQMNNGFNAAPFTPVLEFEAQRAREFYKAAQSLIPLIHSDSRACLWTLAEIYQRLLAKIALANYNVFGEKIRLTTTEKLKVLGQGLLKAAHVTN
jgi:phytoene synthase